MNACKVDWEDESCPAVLHSTIPNAFRVIHVGMRKGGPEALIQLAHALHNLGFDATVDTRVNEHGGKVVPFFQELYMKDPHLAPPVRWFRDYADWQAKAAEGDVLIETETWSCTNKSYWREGVRQIQWRLTVWRKDHLSQCTVVGHTNYNTMIEMKQSKLSLLYPYISPHILKLAQSRPSWRMAKKHLSGKALIIFDADVKMGMALLKKRYGILGDVRRASGLTPWALYTLYEEATVGVDLRLPGAERFVFEAALFDVCIVVDDALIGGLKEDVPLPEEFRVPAHNLKLLHAAIQRCIHNYDAVIPKFAPLKQFILDQETTFLRQVRRYFSNSVHFVSVVCSQEQSDEYLLRFLINVLLYIPFATLEIRLAWNVEPLSQTQRAWLENWSWLAAVLFVPMGPRETFAVCEAEYGESSDTLKAYGHLTIQLARSILLPNASSIVSNARRSLITLFAPLDTVIVSENVIHYISSQLAVQRRRRTFASGEIPLFVLEPAMVRGERSMMLMAMWTANVSSFMCGYFAGGELPLVDGVCQGQRHLSRDAVAHKMVVLHDGGGNVALATRVTSERNLKGAVSRRAWDFMCLHEVWLKFVGGC